MLLISILANIEDTLLAKEKCDQEKKIIFKLDNSKQLF